MWRGFLQIFFEIDRRVAECRLASLGGGGERQHQVVGALREPFMPRPPAT